MCLFSGVNITDLTRREILKQAGWNRDMDKKYGINISW